MLQEITDILSRWRDKLCLFVRNLSLLKISTFSHCSTNLTAIKISVGFLFVEIDKMILEFICKCKITSSNKQLNKNTLEVWTLPVSSVMIKLQCLRKCGIYIRKQSRSLWWNSPEIVPEMEEQRIFNKNLKVSRIKKMSSLQQNNVIPHLGPHTKINSKCTYISKGKF